VSEQTKAVRVSLLNDICIWVETTPLGPVESDAAGFESLTEALSLDPVRKAIEGVAHFVVESFKEAKPAKVSAEFGLELGLDSGQLTALWVKGSGKANLKITFTWEK
jgi:hypothetical protein